MYTEMLGVSLLRVQVVVVVVMMVTTMVMTSVMVIVTILVTVILLVVRLTHYAKKHKVNFVHPYIVAW